jgi:hypothetical protein
LIKYRKKNDAEISTVERPQSDGKRSKKGQLEAHASFVWISNWLNFVIKRIGCQEVGD